ncbi:MAG: FecR domain-containing protein, partial [Bdellovibrionales bacterium]|nr:FecR domain-containing protein [Bdellovibrionales bacterium]
MNIKIALLSLTLLSISSNTFAAYIAKVTKIRGKATVLLPKSKEAKKLSLGDQLFEDSSLLTYKSSYLQITFIDDSVMNIGSQSKLILTKFDNQSNHKIANLIKGQLRTYIKNEPKKQKNKRVKFIIGTQTAALGVRGTEFETIYNEKSNATTLLTYNGEVLIKKKEKAQPTSPKVKETLSFNNIVKSMEKESTVVSEGKYLGVTKSQKEITTPIKISPVQFSLLK